MGWREETLRASLDSSRMPRHIAIIMDGNGRWAEVRGLPRVEGHRVGRQALRRTLEGARECRVEVLTLYAFSTENWRRPQDEVQALMALMVETAQEEALDLQQNGVCFRASGLLDAMPAGVRAAIDQVMALTEHNTQITLNLAVNYGGRSEITAAARQLAREVVEGRMALQDIDERALQQRLFAPDLPDPDLLIRTGGEHRLSNFLLWQAAYAELYFTEIHWPDFRKLDLFEAIRSYQSRKRRFGGVDLG
ncbi:MAG TPA: isoprenyl transferase [bacterium]|nr:isoprenyl transferase [bacterium]